MEITEDARRPVLNRLRRAQGQLSGVIRMLDQGGECEEVLTQLAAVGKALDRAGFQLVTLGIQECLIGEASEDLDVKRLERVFLALA